MVASRDIKITSAFADVINVKSPAYGALGDGSTDDTTALQNAITAAVAANKPLYVPTGLYKYTPPLTIGGNLTIIGSCLTANWNAGINAPLGSPPLVGAVLYPAANGSDAISVTTTSLQINIRDLGILFQTTFGQSATTTGDGFHYVPAGTAQGLSDSRFDNVIVFGHDGNHYAFNLQNPIYGFWAGCGGFGGGVMKLRGSHASANFGNMTFDQLYGQVVTGGTANGVDLSASASQRLNLITFIRPQVITNNIGGLTPAGTPPTSAQSIWSEDANITNIRKISPDWETNVSSPITLGAPAKGNDFDVGSWFTTAASINAPAWTINGLAYGPVTKTYNDTTSSGTVAIAGTFAFPGGPITATSATTYTNYATAYFGTPAASTNVTMTSPLSIYAAGSIITNAAMTAVTGYFSPGTLGIYNTTAPPAGGTAGLGIKVSNVSNFGVFFGTGAPTLAAAQGSLYLRRDGTTTNDRMYVNTNGSTTWTAVTTAA